VPRAGYRHSWQYDFSSLGSSWILALCHVDGIDEDHFSKNIRGVPVILDSFLNNALKRIRQALAEAWYQPGQAEVQQPGILAWSL